MNNNYEKIKISEEMFLNYHLMHPGGESEPGDPNAVFFIDGCIGATGLAVLRLP